MKVKIFHFDDGTLCWPLASHSFQSPDRLHLGVPLWPQSWVEYTVVDVRAYIIRDAHRRYTLVFVLLVLGQPEQMMQYPLL